MASARQIGLFTGVCVLWLVFAPVSAFGSDEDTDQPPSTIVVSATRKPTLVQDEPLHVEAVPAEEIEENLTVEPGNLSSLLAELPSVRVQALAPSLGGAGLQLRELIKGAAAALYGGSALGGVLNLVSRPASSESSLLANATSRGRRGSRGFSRRARRLALERDSHAGRTFNLGIRAEL